MLRCAGLLCAIESPFCENDRVGRFAPAVKQYRANGWPNDRLTACRRGCLTTSECRKSRPPQEWLLTMIEDRLLTWRPETTANE
jgi:hypothetical protein